MPAAEAAPAGRPQPWVDTRLADGANPLLDLWHRKFRAPTEVRHSYYYQFSWAVPNDEALAALAALGPLLEVGAGTGYWAALLRQRGVDIVATDLNPAGTGATFADPWHSAYPAWTALERNDGPAAVRTYPGRTLLLCYPPWNDPMASRTLAAYQGDALAFVGVRCDASPTGDPEFHRQLAVGWQLGATTPLPQWPGHTEALHTYHRRRPCKLQT